MEKKGFTLIELLAVIVVLAIILAIAVPTIISIIDNSKRNSFESSTKLLIKTIQLKLLDNPNLNLNDVSKNTLESLLNVEGDKYASVTARYDANGKVYVIVEGYGDWNNLFAYGTFEKLNIVPKVVIDSLVLNYDAGNLNSYPGTGTTLSDLSPSIKNGSLINGVGFQTDNGGTLVFDGLNDTITLANSVNLGTQWTVETGLKYTDSTKNYEFFAGTPQTSGLIGKIMLRHNGYVTYSYPVNVYNNFNVSSASISGQIKTLAFVSDGTSVKLYVNGILADSKAIANAPLDISTIGNAWGDTVWQAKFNLYYLRCYNKSLTEAEIMQNFNASKSKYGI